MFMIRILLFSLLSLVCMGIDSCPTSSSPGDVRVSIHMGVVDDPGSPWETSGATVSYSFERAPQTFEVAGAWPEQATAVSNGESFPVYAVVDPTRNVTVFYLPFELTGVLTELSIPWSPVITDSAMDVGNPVGGFYHVASPDGRDDIAYMVAPYDTCSSVWPCPADRSLRFAWNVYPPVNVVGYWSPGSAVATTADYVAVQWYQEGGLLALDSGHTVVGRFDYLHELATLIEARLPYFRVIDGFMGVPDSSVDGFGLAEVGSSQGGYVSQSFAPHAVVDVSSGSVSRQLPDHLEAKRFWGLTLSPEHNGEIVISEGPSLALGMLARDSVDGRSLDTEIHDACERVARAMDTATQPAWVPDNPAVPVADLLASLPGDRGALMLLDYATDVYGDPRALGNLLGEVYQASGAGSYGLLDITGIAEDITGVPFAPYLPWVADNAATSALSRSCVL